MLGIGDYCNCNDDVDDLFFRLDFKQPGEKILANVRQIVKNSEVVFCSGNGNDYGDDNNDVFREGCRKNAVKSLVFCKT